MAISNGSLPGIQPNPDPTDISSDPSQYPEWFTDTFLSALLPQIIASYPDVPTRNAAGAPALGASSFAFTQDTGTLWAWWNNQWNMLYSANGGSWTGMTPTWISSTASGPQNLQINSGTLWMRYTQIGKTVTATYELVRGTNTNVGGGDYFFTLPKPPHSWQGIHGSGQVWLQNGFNDAKGLTRAPITVDGVGGTSIALTRCDTGARVGTNTGSWAAGDSIGFTVTYEAS